MFGTKGHTSNITSFLFLMLFYLVGFDLSASKSPASALKIDFKCKDWFVRLDDTKNINTSPQPLRNSNWDYTASLILMIIEINQMQTVLTLERDSFTLICGFSPLFL